MLASVRSLAEAAGVADPDRLARRLHLLMEGAVVTTHVSGVDDAAATARAAAAVLIEAATRS